MKRFVPSFPLLLPLPLFFALQAPAARADEPASTPPAQEPAPEVVVTGTRDPELMSYRTMLAGLDAFDKYHNLAPQAREVRFVLHPRDYGTPIEGTTLNISWGDNATPVPIARDGGFLLPRDQTAADNDAQLMLNRKRGLFGVEIEVNSPGVPANARRVGDIRLACEVSMAIYKKDTNFLKRGAISAVLGSDWCMNDKFNYSITAPQPFDSVTLVADERRVTMQNGHHQRFFNALIGDRSWPDDTLIVFQPSAPATLALYTAQPIYLRGSMNNWGTANELKQVDGTNFAVDVDLPKGRSEFRIASQDSRMVNFGSHNAKVAIADGHSTLFWEGEKVGYDAPQAGKYRFSLNVTRPDEPEVSVSLVRNSD